MQTWALHRGTLCTSQVQTCELQGGSEQEATASCSRPLSPQGASIFSTGYLGERLSDEVGPGRSVG